MPKPPSDYDKPSPDMHHEPDKPETEDRRDARSDERRPEDSEQSQRQVMIHAGKLFLEIRQAVLEGKYTESMLNDHLLTNEWKNVFKEMVDVMQKDMEDTKQVKEGMKSQLQAIQEDKSAKFDNSALGAALYKAAFHNRSARGKVTLIDKASIVVLVIDERDDYNHAHEHTPDAQDPTSFEPFGRYFSNCSFGEYSAPLVIVYNTSGKQGVKDTTEADINHELGHHAYNQTVKAIARTEGKPSIEERTTALLKGIYSDIYQMRRGQKKGQPLNFKRLAEIQDQYLSIAFSSIQDELMASYFATSTLFPEKDISVLKQESHYDPYRVLSSHARIEELSEFSQAVSKDSEGFRDIVVKSVEAAENAIFALQIFGLDELKPALTLTLTTQPIASWPARIAEIMAEEVEIYKEHFMMVDPYKTKAEYKRLSLIEFTGEEKEDRARLKAVLGKRKIERRMEIITDRETYTKYTHILEKVRKLVASGKSVREATEEVKEALAEIRRL